MEQWRAFTSPLHNCFISGKSFWKATVDKCFDEANVENSVPKRDSKHSNSRDLLTDVKVFALQCAVCLWFWRFRFLVDCHQSLGISPEFLNAVCWLTSYSYFDELTAVGLGGGLELYFPSWFMNKVRAEFSNETTKVKSSWKNAQVLFLCMPSVLLKSPFLVTAEQHLRN